MAASQRRPETASPLRAQDHFLIVEGRYYDDIGDHLLAGAEAAIAAAGGTSERVTVPGALEVPVAAALALEAGAASGRPFGGVVALGCIIRGETYHFEIVANESARGLMNLALGRRLPLGNGILTVETEAQALVRADPAQGDKGGEAARAMLALWRLARREGEHR